MNQKRTSARTQNLISELGGFLGELARSSSSADELLAHLTDLTREVFDADRCAIVCTTDGGSVPTRLISASGAPFTKSIAESALFDDGLVATLAAVCSERTAAQFTINSDLTADGGSAESDHPDNSSLATHVNVAVAPIIFDDAAIGVLMVEMTDRGMDTGDLELLQFVAQHVALIHRGTEIVRQNGLDVLTASTRADNAESLASRGEALARIVSAFAGSATRERLYSTLADVVTTELRCDGVGLYRLNPEMGQVRLEFQWGILVPPAPDSDVRTWATALEELAGAKSPVFLEDTEASGRMGNSIFAQQLHKFGIGSAVLLPLVVEDRVQGLLGLRYRNIQRFDEHHKVLLRGAGDQFALALRNTDVREELELRTERLTALARAQHRLTQIAREEALAGGIAEAVNLVVPTARCDIFIRRQDRLERVVCLERGQPASAEFAPLADVALADLTARTGTARMASHLIGQSGISAGWTELCAPIRDGHRTAAVIRLLASPQQALNNHDFELIAILARHAGTAVETTRLFTLQGLQRQRAEGAAELARVALHARQLNQGVVEILRVLDRFVPSIGMAIGIARNRDRIVEYIAASGTLEILRGQQSTTAQLLLGSAEGEAAECHSLNAVVPGLERADSPDECIFALPLIARDRTLGVLVVSTPKTAPLPPQHRVSLERISSSLALALDALLLDEEERLTRDREQLLATAITTISHPIFILDRSGVRYANPAAAREYGWSQYELMEMQFSQLVVSEGARQGPAQPAESAGSEKRDTPVDNAAVFETGLRAAHDIHRRRNGTEFPAVVAVSPLTAQSGEMIGQVISVRNVSQERQIEEQLRSTEKMVAVGELVAGVAHEINNPLTGISAFAQILLEDDLTDDQRESVTLIKHETDRAKSVIHDLLLFARNNEREAGPVDINDALKQVVRLRSYPLRIANVEVRLELAENLPPVTGDAQKLQQVFLNIISNAEFAMHGQPVRVLSLTTGIENDRVTITATDTGKGMTDEIRNRIFEPFFSTRPAGAGSGMGLSVSYGIIRAHGGTIAVESEPGLGTRMTISLPAA